MPGAHSLPPTHVAARPLRSHILSRRAAMAAHSTPSGIFAPSSPQLQAGASSCIAPNQLALLSSPRLLALSLYSQAQDRSRLALLDLPACLVRPRDQWSPACSLCLPRRRNPSRAALQAHAPRTRRRLAPRSAAVVHPDVSAPDAATCQRRAPPPDEIGFGAAVMNGVRATRAERRTTPTLRCAANGRSCWPGRPQV
jgi:hypothetical protein